MSALHKEITFDRFVRGLIVLLGVVALIAAIGYLSGVLIPFFVAWFLAYLIFPIVSFFEKRLHLRSRVVSIVLTLALIVGVVWGLCALAAPGVAHEFEHFKAVVTRFVNSGTDNASIPEDVQNFITTQVRRMELDRLFHGQEFVNLAREALPRMWSFISATANVILTVIASLIALLYLFFILFDYEKLYGGILRMIPQRRRSFFTTLLDDMARGMNSYFRGQALISLCVGILFSIGFMVIQFPLAIPLGIFIGVLSLVPYLHSLGLIPILLFSLLKAADTGQNYWLVLLSALAVFLCVQLIQDLILTPRIMGKAMSLPPFLILLSLSVWGYLLGIIGMIIALPLTTLLISYYKRYVVKDNPPAEAEGEQKS